MLYMDRVEQSILFGRVVEELFIHLFVLLTLVDSFMST